MVNKPLRRPAISRTNLRVLKERRVLEEKKRKEEEERRIVEEKKRREDEVCLAILRVCDLWWDGGNIRDPNSKIN